MCQNLLRYIIRNFKFFLRHLQSLRTKSPRHLSSQLYGIRLDGLWPKVVRNPFERTLAKSCTESVKTDSGQKLYGIRLKGQLPKASFPFVKNGLWPEVVRNPFKRTLAKSCTESVQTDSGQKLYGIRLDGVWPKVVRNPSTRPKSWTIVRMSSQGNSGSSKVGDNIWQTFFY